jgi:hypothetical protein
MPRYILIALILGGALVFLGRIFYQFFKGISGTRSMVAKDLKELDGILDQYELAPWTHAEFDLISRNHDVSAKSELYAQVEHGQFLSIYHEPIMAFATKAYHNNERRLAAIKINDKKYHFDIFGQKVTMSQDEKPIGEVTITDGLQVKWLGHKLHIDAASGSGLIPLSIDDKLTLSIASADEHTASEGRMLHRISDQTAEESELVLLSIAFALANKQI